MTDTVTIVFTSIFIALLVVLLIYLILVVVKEIKYGKNDDKNVIIIDGIRYKLLKVDGESQVKKVEEIKEVKEPLKEEIKEETTSNSDEVVILTTKQKTFKDKYVELNKDQKLFYHNLNDFILSLEGINLYESKFKNMYKYKSIKIATVEIKKDILVCKCNVFNADLLNYAKKEKVSAIKSAPITFKINDLKDVEAAKYAIEVIYKNILDSRNKKKSN